MDLLRLSFPAQGVALVEIDHPPANSLVPELYAELSSVAGLLEEDDRARAVVFASANDRIFVSGADLKRMAPDDLTRASVLERVDRAHAAFLRLQRLGKPTVAAIEGHALGGGCELALAMDFRVMQRGRPRIGLPEVSLALIPAAGGTQRLPRLIGRARAAELIMLAERLDADAAERIGLVNRACDEARAAALELAGRLAEMPPIALRAVKACLNDGVDGDLARGLAAERTAAADAFVQPEAREAIAAFVSRARD
ncbi:MAG: enoyl-CoA hydratase/isomerase family protein [Thermoleophilaceae bacterium]